MKLRCKLLTFCLLHGDGHGRYYGGRHEGEGNIGSPANLYEGFAKKRLKRSNVLIILHFLTIDVLNTAEAAMSPVHGDSFYYSEEDECLIRKMNILVVEIPVVVRISQFLPEEPFIHRQL